MDRRMGRRALLSLREGFRTVRYRIKLNKEIGSVWFLTGSLEKVILQLML